MKYKHRQALSSFLNGYLDVLLDFNASNALAHSRLFSTLWAL